jgi:hypothetical protein
MDFPQNCRLCCDADSLNSVPSVTQTAHMTSSGGHSLSEHLGFPVVNPDTETQLAEWDLRIKEFAFSRDDEPDVIDFWQCSG